MEQQRRIQQLLNHILDVKELLARLEEQPQQDRVNSEVEACHQALEDVVAEYRDLLESAPEKERAQLERRYGRQVIDLRRDAAWLPARSRGDAVPLATRTQWQTAWDTPLPPPRDPTELPPPVKVASPSGPHVGGEIEAWCGSCKGLRLHTIVAMVGDEPKQVICKSCDAKHGFRLTPARGKKPTPTGKKRGKLTPNEAKRLKEDEERAAFQKELADAEDVRPFQRRTRYKAGQIIEHPEHGRGKIESVVKGSLLVRFRSGLRPVSLV